MDDLISRQAAKKAVRMVVKDLPTRTEINTLINDLPSAQPETRTFVELVVEYPDPEICTYKKYKGKPYYSIKYIENGKTHVGYGTYNPEVLSRYLREYFMPSAQPEQPLYVVEIESEYRKAVNMPYIKKPLAKVLYEVWKKHDRDDTERKE